MGPKLHNYLDPGVLLIMVVETISTRPMRELLLQLPMLPTTPDCRIDYEAADPAMLVQLAENAETVMNTINLGLSAVGTILAHASPEVGSEISGCTVETLGWHIAESADAAAALLSLAHACRHHTADYTPPQPKKAPMVTF
jgi:hypothetical protein